VQVNIALAINPLYTEAHNNRGILLARLGRLEDARAEFKTALALTPDYGTVQGNLDAVEKKIAELQHDKASKTPEPHHG
jgi:Flp pilus assembly protein TadD